MCGRFAIYSSAEAIMDYADALNQIDNYDPRYNVVPGTMIPVVIADKQRVLTQMRWGLIPYWAKDEKFASKLINARSESVAEKPSFCNAFQKRRCLIIANGYYEWDQKSKKPYYFYNPSSELIAFAGIWESWKSPKGEQIRTCSIITRAASENISHLHYRMPVILSKEAANDWLADRSQADLINILYNRASKDLKYHPVSIAVNSASNNYPDLIESIIENY